MKISSGQYGIVICTLITAFLHLFLFTRMGPDPIALNGLGYLGLLGAYFLPIAIFQQNHKLVWWVMAGYTVLTIILWVFLGTKSFALDFSNASIGYYAKTAEVLLLIFLWGDKPK